MSGLGCERSEQTEHGRESSVLETEWNEGAERRKWQSAERAGAGDEQAERDGRPYVPSLFFF